MDYHGRLYGKIGNKYFDTGRTSEEFDSMQKLAIKLQLEKENTKCVRPFEGAISSGKKYTKEEILKAAEIGEVSMIDANHIVSLLDEARNKHKIEINLDE